MKELESLYHALGVGSTGEALATINATNERLATLTGLTASADVAQALDRAEASHKLAKALSDELGTDKLGEAVAQLQKLKADAGKAASLEAEAKAAAKSVADRDAKDLIVTAEADGCISPVQKAAAQEMYDKHGAKALADFLGAFPKGSVPVATGSKPAQSNPAGNTNTEGVTPDVIAQVAASLGEDEEYVRQAEAESKVRGFNASETVTLSQQAAANRTDKTGANYPGFQATKRRAG